MLSLIGAWSWIIGGLVFCGLELAVPGAFLIWIGLAAIATGAIAFGFPAMTVAVQLILFAVLAIVFVLLGRKVTASANDVQSEQPFLNRRAEAYRGRVFTLDEGIANGQGRLRIDDTLWRIEGPDMIAGSKVRVVAITGSLLKVEAASSE